MDKGRLRSNMCSVFVEMRRAFVKKLATLGLSYQQWNVLKVIKHSEDPISAKSLVEKLNSDKATISGVVRRLVNAGFLTEQKNPEDKRETLLFLSGNSASMCEMIMELESEFNDQIFSELDNSELEQLDSLLKKMKF